MLILGQEQGYLFLVIILFAYRSLNKVEQTNFFEFCHKEQLSVSSPHFSSACTKDYQQKSLHVLQNSYEKKLSNLSNSGSPTKAEFRIDPLSLYLYEYGNSFYYIDYPSSPN